MIKQHAEIKNVMISGLNTDVLNKVHEVQPDIQLGFIYNRTQQEESRHNSPIDYVIPQFRLASRELIEDVHDEDLHVFAWTVNSEREMRRLIVARGRRHHHGRTGSPGASFGPLAAASLPNQACRTDGIVSLR